ncbi:hypothetical protein [Convivina intestini]|uniref:Uncharacterized protein n=1 Tax=Convivina intestini TaxID=1505726 RepID=A0A2U1DF98_9LACO|nr:hypothetical protein [Convivina intestini]PVY86249.1 hypothetical protein C7384_101164 [Convivina intestini]CAH1851223.1 hypothetical protein R077811_00249 [Convivina intestini]SDB81857.1 hypothetical protein SAMN05216341_101156 [Leuconostocaceae bacterium R-53105]
MQKIKNIFLVAWKSRNFFDNHEDPIGSVQLPEQNDEFDSVWNDTKFGEYTSFEEAQSKLGRFSGGIIKEATPYQINISQREETFFQEEFNLLTDIKKVTSLSTPSGEKLNSTGDLDGYRFYVIESQNDKGITVYHFARFIPRYHVLKNKNLLQTQPVQYPDVINPNRSSFSLEDLILIEPLIFASAIYNEEADTPTIQLFVHNPSSYEKAFNLKDSYFKYAKSKFKQFADSNPDKKRTISIDNIPVSWDNNQFNPDEFFNNKNVNIAKKFARDIDDDKQYPIENIVKANNKLQSSLKNMHRPLKVSYDKNQKPVELYVSEESVGTLAAILDGQIWTNEIHEETQANL